MKKSPKEWKFNVKQAQMKRLPSGGIYPPYGHIGHWEVTTKVIEEMGFPTHGKNIICDASQDPDFYDFGTVAAHAQTSDDADLCGPDRIKRTAIIDNAINDYVEWVAAKFERCVFELENGNVRFSLYWLGYILHGVEDLAVHKGITNGEHASMRDNPDYNDADVKLTYVYAQHVLGAVQSALGQQRFDNLRNYNGEGKLSLFEKKGKEIHPKGWDIDNCLNEYKAAGKRYKSIIERVR